MGEALATALSQQLEHLNPALSSCPWPEATLGPSNLPGPVPASLPSGGSESPGGQGDISSLGCQPLPGPAPDTQDREAHAHQSSGREAHTPKPPCPRLRAMCRVVGGEQAECCVTWISVPSTNYSADHHSYHLHCQHKR